MATFSEVIAYALVKLGSENLRLKEQQLLFIRAVYLRKSVFVWLPTGFGKSICYQSLPFVMDNKLGLSRNSAVLVVSPLTALMVDQIHSLRSKGVKCSLITSSSNLGKPLLATESSLTTDSLLFCAPEALVLPKWRDVLEKPTVSERIVAVVIDEAHCVSKW